MDYCRVGFGFCGQGGGERGGYRHVCIYGIGSMARLRDGYE